MFTRPHCRDWMPLLTQQLRLRNVIKIIGENIECTQNKVRTQCKIYYTLHHNLNGDPIYRSELTTLLGNGSANWAEIDSDLFNKIPCRSICVKVWQKSLEQIEWKNNAYSEEDSNTSVLEKCEDEMLFVWGVNFSGLILIKRSEYKFKPNTLLFQIHGSYFTSPNKITLVKTKVETISQVRQDNVGNINSRKQFHVYRNYDSTSNYLGNKNFKNELTYGSDDSLLNRNCDIRNSSDNIHNTLLPNLSSSLGIQTTHSFHEAVTLAGKRRYTNLSEENIASSNDPGSIEDKVKEFVEELKVRHFSFSFYLNETRSSYNLEKLLEIQKQQRKSKLCLKDLKEISEHIYLRSANCISLQLVANIKPGAIYHNYNKSKSSHSMGRTLNRLLFQEAEIKPEDVLKAQGLKKKIENAKFRIQILKEEKLRLHNNHKKLEKKLSELSDKNVEMGSWLMSRYRNLSKEKEHLLKESLDTVLEKRTTLLKTQAMLRQVKSQFCDELREIFQIEKKTSNKYTICKIYLPNTDELCDAGHPQDSIFVVVPISLSSALGYVAHVVQMCSVVLNIPLRNHIKCEGSRSKIYDNIKELPNNSREFPLYTRTYPPPKSVLYAIYLLNQNIGQLNLQSNGIEHCDPRATLENLLQLLNGPRNMGNFLLQLPNSEQNNESIHNSKQLKSASSTDLNLVAISSGIASKSVDVADYIIRSPSNINSIGNDQRISRSVGSYSDENLSDTSDKIFYNSEPNLTTHSIAVHLENFAKNENF
ncbi:UV radiation resistance-associated gene protein [Condylostylus longicornis]|uniref:UV radiation resistance-associated gene protein n=1 Tax=Condylostylus longicornis TaxID=2530218 RepID=UPI00244DB6CB|nr:UV radiation resistance-associated gene protein [Condylostylus longicornis]